MVTKFYMFNLHSTVTEDSFIKTTLIPMISNKGSLQKKKTSYLVTLSKRGGRGQNEITILGALEIMTSLEGRGGLQN